MPLLEIVTRHLPSRVEALAANQASLQALKGDWVQTLLVDEERRGVSWANRRLAMFEPVGKYVWILDDDDLAVYPDLVVDLRRLTLDGHQDMIMVQIDHCLLGTLPDASLWGRTPQEGHISSSSAIVRREHWIACRGAWTDRYAGDYDFMAEAYARAWRRVWHPVIACHIPHVSQGAA